MDEIGAAVGLMGSTTHLCVFLPFGSPTARYLAVQRAPVPASVFLRVADLRVALGRVFP